MSACTNPFGIPDDELAREQAGGYLNVTYEGKDRMRIEFGAGSEWAGESGSFVLPAKAAESLLRDLPYHLKMLDEWM